MIAVSSASDPVVETMALTRVLEAKAGPPRTILRDANLVVRRGEFVAVTGSSGSGKSTLLYLLGALDRPTSGRIELEGIDIGGLDDDERARVRNERLGFVFQFHFLLPEFTVLENVLVPMVRRAECSRAEAEVRALASLEMFGMRDFWRRKPGQLSGGEQQRVAVARAIANDPVLILADEPTGSLDSKNASLVFDVLGGLAREQGRAVIVVTHDAELAARADRQVRLSDGRIVSDARQRA